MAITTAQYNNYLKLVAEPFKYTKLAKLEFLNPDGSVAFEIDNDYKKSGTGGKDSRAFLQDGQISVSLQNGIRRKASIILDNLDSAFDYNVNNLWFGTQIRLSMGILSPSGEEYYLPQGVFYIESPELVFKPSSKTMQYSLVDKWAYLDGSLFGKLLYTTMVKKGENIYNAIENILKTSKYDLQITSDILKQIDNIQPVFTTYYQNKTSINNGIAYPLTEVPQDITEEYGKSYADIILALNKLLVGWVGYNSVGAFVLTASQNDVNDSTKPVLWDFTTNSKTFLGFNESIKNSSVYNDIIVYGESNKSSTATPPMARAINDDAKSDVSIGQIGRKTTTESSNNYFLDSQCQALAKFRLERSAVLNKSITLSASQLFHLTENDLITIRRNDKEGSPVEKHIIQSFTLPIAQSKPMTITATSVADYPQITIADKDN